MKIYTNNTDWFIAENYSDLVDLLLEHDYEVEDTKSELWRAMRPWERLQMWWNDARDVGKIPKISFMRVDRTPGMNRILVTSWVFFWAKMRRGLLCSNET